MTLTELLSKLDERFNVVNLADDADQRNLSKVFCCDLLSFAMARNPADSVWVTVMGNVNTIGVMSLTDGAAVIIAENAAIDEIAAKKADEQNITVIKTALPVFETALTIHELIK
jgi:predicted transcriptional regulator